MIASSATSATVEIEKEFGHWVVGKKVDDFDPSIATCAFDSLYWTPETHREPETLNNWYIRFNYKGKSITPDGTIAEGVIAEFFEWNTAHEQWDFASDLFVNGLNFQNEPQPVRAKVDGKTINFMSPTLVDELKGKVELTYRFTAHNLPNMPMHTRTVSLIGFTQAFNYARQICG